MVDFEEFEVTVEAGGIVLIDGMEVKADRYGDLPYFIKHFAQELADDRGETVTLSVVGLVTEIEFKPEKEGEEEE